MLKALANIMSRIAPQRGTSTVSSSPAASHAPHGSGARGGRRLVVAKFDSAKTTPENRKHWANADGLSPNASINPEVRRVLRNRARYEVANNSYAKGIVLTLANDTIGTGPRLQMLTTSSASRRPTAWPVDTRRTAPRSARAAIVPPATRSSRSAPPPNAHVHSSRTPRLRTPGTAMTTHARAATARSA
jgi:hypothetical protein